MSEKIAQLLGPEPRTLKVGKSFERNSGRTAYHGIRYDFKPVSIDEERDGTLEVRERNEVAVSLPHVGGSGQTNYKGHIRDISNKDCVLVIDHETGEITIERLSNQILLKKTRPEKSDNKSIEEKLNPYEVKKVPDRPNFPSRETLAPPPSNKRTIPTQPSETETSSSSRAPVAAKPRNIQTKMTATESSSCSSSSSSSDSSDEDSDFEDHKKDESGLAGGGGMPKFNPQDSTFSRGGGVLPTARPQPHKSKKSQDSSNKSRSKPHQHSNQMEMPTLTAPVASASLDDDLRLSEDSD